MKRPTDLAVLAAAMLLAGCGWSLPSPPSFPGFGGNRAPEVVVNPDPYPTNYRKQIATLLTLNLQNRADFHGALISAPALKPVAESQTPHYVVCVQFTGHNDRRTKAVVYLEGKPNQFIDATPQQCSDATYQPFTELEYERPER